jgi:hypothetical protein
MRLAPAVETMSEAASRHDDVNHKQPSSNIDLCNRYPIRKRQLRLMDANSTVAIDQNSKRQRRQTAGGLIVSMLGGGGAKKSTAQPRPTIEVLPRGIGPVAEPNVNDVLCGRGGRINSHSGNVQFRDFVQARKKDYLDKKTKKLEKAHIAAELVRHIRNMDPPGRFLKEGE